VLAAELEPPSRGRVREAEVRVLQEPEADLGRARGREAVEPEIDDQVTDVILARVDRVRVGRRVGVRDVVLVQRLTGLPKPARDVEIVLRAAALELGAAVPTDIRQDPRERVLAAAATVQRVPVVARESRSAVVGLERIPIELEQAQIVNGDRTRDRHNERERAAQHEQRGQPSLSGE
jgi:hypothetical protein